MTVNELVYVGYKRDEVHRLFETLQSLGFGEYIKGPYGQYGDASFIANQDCPETYTLSVKKRTRRKKEQKVLDNKSIFDHIYSIPHYPYDYSMPSKLGTGYACSVGDNYLFVDRIAGGGYDSIEEAVSNIWEYIESNVPIKGTKEMSAKDHVASYLKGFGFYKLSN
jgi:hypothetical protein